MFDVKIGEGDVRTVDRIARNGFNASDYRFRLARERGIIDLQRIGLDKPEVGGDIAFFSAPDGLHISYKGII